MSLSFINNHLASRYEHEPLYRQAVAEVLESLESHWASAGYNEEQLARLERLIEPERIITFRVTWTDDTGALQHNLGYRVQFNSALGPYKGGLRFDSSVTVDTLKFLGFEQVFKNALTGLPLGAGKGGSDFDKKGKTDREIRNFCRSFMLALYRELGIDRDVPAGDIGVGGREIGYMFGMYKEISGNDEGVLTGKNELFGGSCQRTEATGHGVVYMAKAAAAAHNFSLEGQRAVVSGSGNVALYAARALIDHGAVVIAVSDRNGHLFKTDGLTHTDLDEIETKKYEGAALVDINITDAEYQDGTPWSQSADLYVPCATQNEVDADAARAMSEHAKLVIEGANMPLSAEAVEIIQRSSAVYVPGKAANAGGVAVSGLEMAQNAARLPWTCEEVDQKLQTIMGRIHDRCVEYGKREDGSVDYVKGANIAGFVRVFEAMEKLGW